MGLRWTGLGRGLAAGCVVCGSLAGGLLALAPATGATRGADLVISEVQIDRLPVDPYVLVDSNGATDSYQVQIITENVGDSPAEPSEGLLEVQDASDDSVIATRKFDVGRLGPHDSEDTVLKGRLHPPLGHIRFVVKANANGKVSESNTDNNEHKGKPVPVIAKEWKANAMSVSGKAPYGTFVDQIVRGEFFFRFKYFDGEQFRYQAYGEVKAIQNYGPVCTAHGVGTAKHEPWSTGGLAIDYQLKSYQAYVAAGNEPAFRFPFYCGGHLVGQAAGSFVNLQTLKGGTQKQPMRSSAKYLVDGSEANGVRYSWAFRAAVP